MEKVYKGVKISLNESTGEFSVSINNSVRSFGSLKGAMKAIDKHAIAKFKPMNVLLVEEDGINPTKYTVRRITLTGYEEVREYRRRDLSRYFLTDVPGTRIRLDWRHEKIYPVSMYDKLVKNCKEQTEQERIQYAADEKADRLEDQREKWAIDINTIDPKNQE